MSPEPRYGFTNISYLLKTEIHTRTLNREPFLCNFRGLTFLQSKMSTETHKFKFILACSSTNNLQMAFECPNWAMTDP